MTSPMLLPGASLVAQRLRHLPAMQETWIRSLGWEDPLEKEMATHSSQKDTCTPMFIVELFTIVRLWKQPRCSSTDEWIRKLWYIYHIFFIHSSVDGHLGCFHVLAVVTIASVDIGVYVSFQIVVFSGCMPRSGIVGPCCSSRLSFLKTSILFSIVPPPNSH